jgi:hypothetical protein
VPIAKQLVDARALEPVPLALPLAGDVPSGDVRWSVRTGDAPPFEQRRLATRPTGDVLAVTFPSIFDGGLRACCRAAADGAQRWSLTNRASASRTRSTGTASRCAASTAASRS